jgi:protein TonB
MIAPPPSASTEAEATQAPPVETPEPAEEPDAMIAPPPSASTEAEATQAPPVETPVSEPAAPVADLAEPVVVQRVEPTLPPRANKGKGGTVVLKVLVNEQGRISRVLVERGIPGSDLEAAAISAVLRWKFRPATRNGEPIRSWTKATFVFGK